MVSNNPSADLIRPRELLRAVAASKAPCDPHVLRDIAVALKTIADRTNAPRPVAPMTPSERAAAAKAFFGRFGIGLRGQE